MFLQGASTAPFFMDIFFIANDMFHVKQAQMFPLVCAVAVYTLSQL